MVSLESKNQYLSKISESLKLRAFNHLLSGRTFVLPQGIEVSEVDEVFYGIISAIQTNDRTAFEKYYNKKSKSNPSKESPSPFVNDDFLIFSIILGVTKYNIEISWIKNIVSIRRKNAITTTFDNLLEQNYYSTSNLLEVVMMFLHQINPSLITNDFLNSTFKRINEKTDLFNNKNDFQILCSIQAYNSIIQLKTAPEGSEIHQLKLFNAKFIKRTKFLSLVLQAGVVGFLIYSLLQLPIFSPDTVEYISKYGYVFTILSALGITFLGNKLAFISLKSHELTMRLFGYPKDIINVQ